MLHNYWSYQGITFTLIIWTLYHSYLLPARILARYVKIQNDHRTLGWVGVIITITQARILGQNPPKEPEWVSSMATKIWPKLRIQENLLAQEGGGRSYGTPHWSISMENKKIPWKTRISVEYSDKNPGNISGYQEEFPRKKTEIPWSIWAIFPRKAKKFPRKTRISVEYSDQKPERKQISMEIFCWNNFHGDKFSAEN